MKRVLSLAGVTATAVALAGCASQTTGTVSAPQSSGVSLGTALGVTGAILLVPVALLAIVFFVMGLDYQYSWKRTADHKRVAKIALIVACVLLGVACILWITAIWSGIGGM